MAPTHQPRTDTAPTEEVSAVSFLQNGTVVAGTDGVTHAGVKCYNCNSQGHYANTCPKDMTVRGTTLLQAGETVSSGAAGEAGYVSGLTFVTVT